VQHSLPTLGTHHFSLSRHHPPHLTLAHHVTRSGTLSCLRRQPISRPNFSVNWPSPYQFTRPAGGGGNDVLGHTHSRTRISQLPWGYSFVLRLPPGHSTGQLKSPRYRLPASLFRCGQERPSALAPQKDSHKSANVSSDEASSSCWEQTINFSRFNTLSFVFG